MTPCRLAETSGMQVEAEASSKNAGSNHQQYHNPQNGSPNYINEALTQYKAYLHANTAVYRNSLRSEVMNKHSDKDSCIPCVQRTGELTDSCSWVKNEDAVTLLC